MSMGLSYREFPAENYTTGITPTLSVTINGKEHSIDLEDLAKALKPFLKEIE